MKNNLFLLFAFAAVFVTGVEFGIQPVTAAQKDVEQMKPKNEIVEAVTPQRRKYTHHWWGKGKRRQ